MTFDTRPQNVDLLHYAGDTLTVRISAPASVTDGMTWNAQVRSVRASDTIDATWDVIPPAVSGGPAYITLSSEATSALVGGAPVVSNRATDGSIRSYQQYLGEWDCQVSDAGDDPVRTLVQGKITITLDVTRLDVSRLR